MKHEAWWRSGLSKKELKAYSPKFVKLENILGHILDKDRLVVSPSGESTIDFVSGESGKREVVFTIGIGETSLFYLDKKKLDGDRWIYRSKKLEEIPDDLELAEAIYEFIMTEPLVDEIIDVSKETLLERMNSNVAKHEKLNFGRSGSK